MVNTAPTKPSLEIRRFEQNNTDEIVQLFHDTVHNINHKDYSIEQINAWAPNNMDKEKWCERLSSKMTYVVIDNGKILAFGELESDGHIDCFYTHHQHQGKGIGSLLLQYLENQARTRGVKKLYAEVSVTAKSFFEQKGFCIITDQYVESRGETFLNYLMEKQVTKE